MNKIKIILIILLSIPTMSFAQGMDLSDVIKVGGSLSGLQPAPTISDCTSSISVDKNAGDKKLEVGKIISAFSNYAQSPMINNKYKICFNMVGDNAFVVANTAMDHRVFSFQFPANQVIEIVDLKLERKDFVGPLLQINAAAGSTVKLKNVGIANVVDDGIITTGSGIVELDGVNISGDPLSKTGKCLYLRSDNAKVIGGDYSNCMTGIWVEGHNVEIGTLTDLTKIHDNRQGIVATGSGIWWATSIYGNGLDAADGIWIPDNNPHKFVPEIKAGDDGERAIRITLDQSGNPISGELQFERLPSTGKVAIYWVPDHVLDKKQGKNFLVECNGGLGSPCILDSAAIARLPNDNQCSSGQCYFTAMVTSTSSSMYVKEPFASKKISSVPAVLIPTIEGMPAGLTSGNAIGGGVENEFASGDDTLSAPKEEPKIDGAAGMTQAAQGTSGEISGSANSMSGPKCALTNGSTAPSILDCVVIPFIVLLLYGIRNRASGLFNSTSTSPLKF